MTISSLIFSLTRQFSNKISSKKSLWTSKIWPTFHFSVFGELCGKILKSSIFFDFDPKNGSSIISGQLNSKKKIFSISSLIFSLTRWFPIKISSKKSLWTSKNWPTFHFSVFSEPPCKILKSSIFFDFHPQNDSSIVLAQ